VDIKDSNVLVLGFGVSGRAASTLCASRGARVTVTDMQSEENLREEIEGLGVYPIRFLLGQQPPAISGYDLIVVSPGFSSDLPMLERARRTGIMVWGEIELGFRLCSCPVVAVTGTNGKSTTTVLVGHLFEASGYRVHVGGNIGIPFTSLVADMQDGDVAVIEVSARQLRTCNLFAPRTAVITNVRPEHMDAYGGDFDRYAKDKAKITANHDDRSSTIANFDDKICREIASSSIGRKLFFSARPLPRSIDGVYIEDGRIVAQVEGAKETICSIGSLAAKDALPNLLAMASVGLCWNVSLQTVAEVSVEYPGREHVVEYVGTSAVGLAYYNDSKATNPYSVIHALEQFAGENVVLICGGKGDKNVQRETWIELARAIDNAKVRHVILIGQTGPDIGSAIESISVKAFSYADTLDQAFLIANEVAQSGDSVLFSPGANSRDLFPGGHRARGDAFRVLARAQIASGPNSIGRRRPLHADEIWGR
jgi:UDP-N-acetylmuramoylalanine--D-glutamate ligase